MSKQPAAPVFSTAFGLLMVAAAAVGAGKPAIVMAGLALAAMLVGLRYRSAATLSVLLVIVVVVMSNPPGLYPALSGLSAAAYLVLRHAASLGVVTTTRPTVLGMVGFTLVGVVATLLPPALPWLPLAAPAAAVALFVVAALPFLRGAHGR